MAEWQTLSSGHVAAARYDESTKTLSVRFKTGVVYDYSGVAEEDAEGLFSASSAGTYLHNDIVPSYAARRVG